MSPIGAGAAGGVAAGIRCYGRLAVSIRASALAALAATLLASSAAEAATLSVAQDVGSEERALRYVAAAGEQNRLAVTEDAATVTFHDPGASIQLDGGCELAGPSTAICRKDQVGSRLVLRVELGDADDTARADLSPGGAFDPDSGWVAMVRMSGGPGLDELVGSDLPREYRSGDVLDGGAGADRLSGRGGVDTLDGGAGPDRLDGGAGTDFLQGRGHDADPADDADLLLGGDGIDRVEYAAQYFWEPGAPERYRAVTTDVRVTGDGAANDGAAGERDDVGAGVEGVYLGNGDDVVETGGDLAAAHGGGGNDELRAGGSGGAHLQGGAGNDVLTGSAGQDSLGGHDGNDRLVGGPGRDTVSGDEGDDWIDTRDPPAPAGPDGQSPGHDWVQCGGGQDEIYPDESEIRTMAPWDGCEVVHPPGPAEPPPAAVIGSSAAATTARVTLTVRCGADVAACSGALVLKTTSSRRVVARGRVTGRRGKSRTVSVPLTADGRRLLRRSARLETRATLKPRAQGARAVTRRVVVKRRR